jgi:ABC-type nitrate/sulfonate/bicarbonate transport system permease component
MAPRARTLFHAASESLSLAPRAQRVRAISIYLVSFLVMILVWDRASISFDLPALFPRPGGTLSQLLALLSSAKMGLAIAASLTRIAAGFAIGSMFGATVGLGMAYFSLGRAIGAPLVHFLRFIPAMAWFAPFLLWFGVGEQTRILLIVYTKVFIVILNTMAGVASVAPSKIRMARSFGATRLQVFLLIVLPASAPFILTGTRIAMGNSFMTVVAAEMLSGGPGIGYLIFTATVSLDTTTMFSGVLSLGVIGLLADRLLATLTRRFGSRYYARATAFAHDP